MRDIYIIADNIYSPLGTTTAENFDRVSKGVSAVKQHSDTSRSVKPFYASLFEEVPRDNNITKFEQLLIQSIREATEKSSVNLTAHSTGMILSSTKGNISLIEQHPADTALKERIAFSSSAKKIQQYFGLAQPPLVVSHACISGLVALITARRLLLAGKYDTIIVSGTDVISKFILSGFQSFHAVSDDFCKPFDLNRNGINLGEAAATIVLSVHKPAGDAPVIQLTGGAVSNDANHISGPSRTGEELAQAITAAIAEAGIEKNSIDFISAHGTATIYNDDMESKAIRIIGLQEVPVNSLKGYYGHTLGAAGLLETVISIESLKQNKIIPTKGFETPGTAEVINVCSELVSTAINTCLKTASGFGGCNAAIILSKP